MFLLFKKGTSILLRHVHIDTPRRWSPQKTSAVVLGRPRSLEPATVLALADIASPVCSRVSGGAGVLQELLDAHLDTLGVPHRFSTRESRKFMRSLGYSFKEPKGELGKKWPTAMTQCFQDRVDPHPRDVL